MFYHVAIGLEGDDETFQFDLSRNKLKSMVDKYENGTKFHCGGRVVDPFKVVSIEVRRTEDHTNDLIENDEDEEIYDDDVWEIVVELGDDVTNRVITRVPEIPKKEEPIQKHQPVDIPEPTPRIIYNSNTVHMPQTAIHHTEHHPPSTEKKSWWKDNFWGYVTVSILIGVVVGIILWIFV